MPAYLKIPLLISLGIFFLFAYLWSPGQLTGQAQGSIAGQLRTATGSLVSTQLLVTITNHGAVVYRNYADSEGHFGVNSLPGGTFHILIDDEAYQPVDEEVRIEATSSPSMQLVTIFLVPRKISKPDAPDEVKGGNPNLTNASVYTKQVPASAIKEFEAGVKADDQHKIEDAIKRYEKALKLSPTFYAARNNLGSDYLNKGDYNAAQGQFEEVVKINPADAAAYFNMGNLHLLTKHYTDAQNWVDQGLSRQPDSAFGYFLRGSINTQIRKFGEAETALRRCLELSPIMAKAHLALVNLYLEQHRNDDAIAELKIFVNSFPDDPLAAHAKELIGKLGGPVSASSPEH